MEIEKQLRRFEEGWKILEEEGFNPLSELIKEEEKKLTNTNYTFTMNKKAFLRQYNLVYDLMMIKNQDIRRNLESKLLGKVRNYCEEAYKDIGNNNQILFQIFIKKWCIFHKLYFQYIQKIFKFLDKVKKMNNRGSSLETEINPIFKTAVYDNIKDNLYNDFLQLINDFRNNKNVDLIDLKEYIQYLRDFKEEKYINDYISKTEEYFTNLVNSNDNSSFLQYMQFAKNAIDRENILIDFVFENEKKDILRKLYNILYYKNSIKLLKMNDGFDYLLNDCNHKELLKYVFAIFYSNETSFNLMNNIFKNFIKTSFKEKLINTYNFESYSFLDIVSKTNIIQQYLLYQNYIIDIINNCFNSNNLMHLIFKEGLSDIQNTQDKYNFSIILPYYFHFLLMNKPINIDNIKIGLEIFPYIPDKDLMIDIYRNLLSERIIYAHQNNDPSIFNIKIETLILEEMSKECGTEFINKIKNIINDYELNIEEIEKKYSQIDSTNSIKVFSKEFWPNYINLNQIILPPLLDNISKQMKTFYHNTFPGRNIEFSYNNSILVLSAKISGKIFDIYCSTFHGIILLKINELLKSNKFIDKKFIEQMFTNKSDYITSIKQLVESGLIMENDSSYIVNFNFNSNTNIIQLIYKDNFTIKKKEKQEVDRSYCVDAHIVKIIKSNQNISHTELIMKVINALYNFNVGDDFIVKRINNLLEREIIFKSKSDENCYVYGEIQPQKQEDISIS